MTTNELIALADRELDSRNLAQPSMRKNAVRRIVRFMEDTGSFLNGKSVVLPADKKAFKEAFAAYIGKEPYGAENGAISIIYQVAGVPSGSYVPKLNPSSTVRFVTQPKNVATVDIKSIEDMLVRGKFVPVNSLTDSTVPDIPGLYCIKLRKGVAFPTKYGKVRDDGVIYIGLASRSLRQRFWKQELNHIGAATFFRGIGAILGYLPPKGSLCEKDTKNYKFSDEDTEAIREWNRQSLLVNWIPMDVVNIGEFEKRLIEKYQPLMNTSHNPNPSKELAAARKRCREYAQSK